MQRKKAEKATRVPHSGRTRGEAAATDLMANVSRVMDRRPREFSVIYAAIQGALKGKPIPETQGLGEAFIVSAFAQLYPSLLESKVVKAAMDRILADFATLPSTRATRLRRGPAPQSVGPGAAGVVVAVGVGLAAGLVLCGIIAIYMATHEGDDKKDEKQSQ